MMDLKSDEVFELKETLFNKIVCAPKEMTDQDIEDSVSPSGTRSGWKVANSRKDVRVQCGDCEDREHVMLEC